MLCVFALSVRTYICMWLGAIQPLSISRSPWIRSSTLTSGWQTVVMVAWWAGKEAGHHHTCDDDESRHRHRRKERFKKLVLFFLFHSCFESCFSFWLYTICRCIFLFLSLPLTYPSFLYVGFVARLHDWLYSSILFFPITTTINYCSILVLVFLFDNGNFSLSIS